MLCGWYSWDFMRIILVFRNDTRITIITILPNLVGERLGFFGRGSLFQAPQFPSLSQMFSLRQTAAAFRRNISPWKPLPLFRHHGHSRFFHTSRPRPSPIIPLPAALAAMLKTGKLVSFVSLSSKTSLTLLPHTWYRDRGRLFVKLLASVPVIGFSLLVVVGLDQVSQNQKTDYLSY